MREEKKRWSYVIAGVIMLFFAGVIYAWSIISKTFLAVFPEWSAAQISMNFTITMCMFCAGCLLTGVLEKRLSVGQRVRLAAVFMLAGFLLTSVTTSLVTLYLGFGILSGLGAGIAYNSVISTVTAWFPEKKGLVSGILLMGFGFSSFLIGKIYTAVTHLDSSNTWRWTFRVFAILVFIVFALLSFFIKKPETEKEVRSDFQSSSKEEDGYTTGEMVRKLPFWCYYIWAVVFSATGLVLVSQSSIMATDIGTGISTGTIATVVGLISVLNGIGRITFGALYDRIGYRKTMILDMSLFLITEMILLFAISRGHFLLLVCAFVAGGFAYGGVMPMNTAIVDEFFGRKYYTMNFSIISTNLLFASFASTAAGSLYDKSQSYVTTVFMMLIMSVIGIVVFFGIRKPKQAVSHK